MEQNLDLKFIGSGGFANVYLQKSTGLIVKKLKDEYLSDDGICSRFKREYSITKSLSDLQAIIKVYDYYEDSCSYTMEKATNDNALFRHQDAEQLLKHIEKTIAYHLQAENKEQILEKISLKQYDEEIETYISELSSEEICRNLINYMKGFPEILINYNYKNDGLYSSIFPGLWLYLL